MIPDKKLDFWIEQAYNVLLVGNHGVGKTSVIMSAFKRHNLKALYFSSSTMDPWVDLIGVPKAVEGDDGEQVLDLIRPKALVNGDIEAIFFDEFNRAHKKIRNACLELIQFKSINGNPFPNLKFVWAAINPDDTAGTYDVDRLDPAQEDRFHIIHYCPNSPDMDYFVSKFGDQLAQSAIEWWSYLDPTAQAKVSPRRLDYALTIALAGGDLADVISSVANHKDLAQRITVSSYGARVIMEGKESSDKLAKLFTKHPASIEVARNIFNTTEDKNVAVNIFIALPAEARGEWFVDSTSCSTEYATLDRLIKDKNEKNLKNFLREIKKSEPSSFIITIAETAVAEKKTDPEIDLNAGELDLFSFPPGGMGEAYNVKLTRTFVTSNSAPSRIQANQTLPVFRKSGLIMHDIKLASPAFKRKFLTDNFAYISNNTPFGTFTNEGTEAIGQMAAALKGLQGSAFLKYFGVSKKTVIKRLMLEYLLLPSGNTDVYSTLYYLVKQQLPLTVIREFSRVRYA